MRPKIKSVTWLNAALSRGAAPQLRRAALIILAAFFGGVTCYLGAQPASNDQIELSNRYLRTGRFHEPARYPIQTTIRTNRPTSEDDLTRRVTRERSFSGVRRPQETNQTNAQALATGTGNPPAPLPGSAPVSRPATSAPFVRSVPVATAPKPVVAATPVQPQIRNVPAPAPAPVPVPRVPPAPVVASTKVAAPAPVPVAASIPVAVAPAPVAQTTAATSVAAVPAPTPVPVATPIPVATSTPVPAPVAVVSTPVIVPVAVPAPKPAPAIAAAPVVSSNTVVTPAPAAPALPVAQVQAVPTASAPRLAATPSPAPQYLTTTGSAYPPAATLAAINQRPLRVTPTNVSPSAIASSPSVAATPTPAPSAPAVPVAVVVAPLFPVATAKTNSERSSAPVSQVVTNTLRTELVQTPVSTPTPVAAPSVAAVSIAAVIVPAATMPFTTATPVAAPAPASVIETSAVPVAVTASIAPAAPVSDPVVVSAPVIPTPTITAVAVPVVPVVAPTTVIIPVATTATPTQSVVTLRPRDPTMITPAGTPSTPAISVSPQFDTSAATPTVVATHDPIAAPLVDPMLRSDLRVPASTSLAAAPSPVAATPAVAPETSAPAPTPVVIPAPAPETNPMLVQADHALAAVPRPVFMSPEQEAAARAVLAQQAPAPVLPGEQPQFVLSKQGEAQARAALDQRRTAERQEIDRVMLEIKIAKATAYAPNPGVMGMMSPSTGATADVARPSSSAATHLPMVNGSSDVRRDSLSSAEILNSAPGRDPRGWAMQRNEPVQVAMARPALVTPTPATPAAPAAPANVWNMPPETESQAREILNAKMAELSALAAATAAASKAAPAFKPAPKPAPEQIIQPVPMRAEDLQSGASRQRLSELLDAYQANRITPFEYHRERARIISER